MIKLNAEFKPEFDFGQDQSKDGEGAAEVDFTGKEPLGKCPKCGAHVFENGDELRLREGGRPEQDLRFPHRQNHFAADRSTARR